MPRKGGGRGKRNKIENEDENDQGVLLTEETADLVQKESSDGDGDSDGDSDEEDEDAYRLRVYGNQESTIVPSSSRSSSLRKLSKRLSKRFSQSLIRRRSSLVEALPDTPKGWMILSCMTMSAILAYEVRLQKSLTKPPITFCQLPSGSFVEKVFEQMTEEPSHESGTRISSKILSRSIQPSLFIGTRGVISSTAAYLGRGPSSETDYLRFREIFTMSQDGARIAVDWEVRGRRQDKSGGKHSKRRLESQHMKQSVLNGPISHPVVLILHGINNDSSFGYMKSLSRSFCNRGYISASMNFRGCGGLSLSTPRGYNAAYTGDLRSLVRQISARLEKNVSIFLVGNSLGANIMTKYLGEEGLFGTLPKCISGAASLGNPLLIDSKVVRFPFNFLMALGVKKIFLENLRTIRGLNDSRSKEILKKGFLAPTISKFDNAIAPSMIRNNPHYPFETKIGYDDGEAYWFDASSYRYVRHISVPFLNITAQDDFLVSKPSRNKLGFCLANPNVMIVETRCGGHLGWHETPPDSAFGAASWADTAASEFFDAILNVDPEAMPMKSAKQINTSAFEHDHSASLESMHKKQSEVKSEALAFAKTHISRL